MLTSSFKPQRLSEASVWIYCTWGILVKPRYICGRRNVMREDQGSESLLAFVLWGSDPVTVTDLTTPGPSLQVKPPIHLLSEPPFVPFQKNLPIQPVTSLIPTSSQHCTRYILLSYPNTFSEIQRICLKGVLPPSPTSAPKFQGGS